MRSRAQIAELYRRVGFGLAPGQLDDLDHAGVDAALDALVDRDGGSLAADDPWAGTDLAGEGGDGRRSIGTAIDAWLDAMATTARPLPEHLRWFWHGHFVSALPEVKALPILVEQLRTFGPSGAAEFPDLLREVTIDGAMLRYLDGAESRVGAVNENYGREVLELFTLGVGNYTEADVRAAAVALTGWTARQNGTVQFEPRRHDDTPQVLLGRSDVHDVGSVVAAIVDHEACAPFVTRQLADAVLGPGADDERLAAHAEAFRADGLRVGALVRRLLEDGLDGGFRPLVLAPVPWLASVSRATGVRPSQLGRPYLALLRSAGQLPLYPPNVGGWPGGRAWLASSTTVARCSLATFVAAATAEDQPARQAADRRDWPALADALGMPDGFCSATEAAVDGARTAGPVEALAVALGSPDLAVVPGEEAG